MIVRLSPIVPTPTTHTDALITVAIYRSKIILIPQLGFGISILTATAEQGQSEHVRTVLSNLVTSKLLSSVSQVAKSQAHAAYAGHYTALPHLNSSITITTDDLPGLKITSWICNGTDVLSTLIEPNLGKDYRMTPNSLYDKGSSKVGFMAQFNVFEVYADPVANGDPTSWYWNCKSWTAPSDVRCGDVGLEQFAFKKEGKDGKVKSAYSKVLRIELEKVK